MFATFGSYLSTFTMDSIQYAFDKESLVYQYPYLLANPGQGDDVLDSRKVEAEEYKKLSINLPKTPFNGMSWRFLAVTTTFRDCREVGCTGEPLSRGWPELVAGSLFSLPWDWDSEPAPLPN